MVVASGQSNATGSGEINRGHEQQHEKCGKAMNEQEYMQLESDYGCHNYKPLPVVLSTGRACTVIDVNGKEYLDFLSAYSSLNQGHLNPRLVRVVVEQLTNLSLTSRAFYSNKLGLAEKLLCKVFKYDKCLFMNTGAEAVESAIKLTRRWGYDKKKIPRDEAIIVVGSGNFHGRTTTVISFSDDPTSYGGFGPFTPGFLTVEYGNAEALASLLTTYGPRVAGVLLEPIQGEAGIVVPPPDYLFKVSQLCQAHNCLFIIDEIQAGLGRTGDLLCHYYDHLRPEQAETSLFHHTNVRPDMVCLGKALGGGLYPVSCVLADNEVMLCINPGEHGSTYGGNPMACAVAIEAIKVILEENLCQKAKERGKQLEKGLREIQSKYPRVIEAIRGRGLFYGVQVSPNFSAGKLCLKMKDLGLLAKPTHETIIRLSPPLIISEAELAQALQILDSAIKETVREYFS